MPIYAIETALPAKLTGGKAIRLVNAANRAQARKYIAASTIDIGTPTQAELVVLVKSGLRVENAVDPDNDSLGTLRR